MEKHIKDIGKLNLKQKIKKSYFPKNEELSPNDFDEMNTFLLKNKQCTAILFYAPWCNFCKEVKDLWKELKTYVDINIRAMNCEKYKTHKLNMNIDYSDNYNKLLIKTVPTIYLYKNGKPYKKFTNKRTLINFIKFCKK